MSTGAPKVPCYGGRFELWRQLGEGGFGVVYQAFDRRRRAVVALKELTRAEPKALARFKNEFRALVGLVHPNLVTLYELFAEDGRWYFTMEYVEGVDFLTYVWGGGGGRSTGGPSLTGEPSPVPAGASAGWSPSQAPRSSSDSGEGWGERVRTDQRPSTEDASTIDVSVLGPADLGRVGISRVRAAPKAGVFDEARLRSSLAQLAAGVEALHASGRLHRDLKPTNVRVTRDGRVVVLDFGLVVALGSAEEADRRELAGTPAYMSPEQACQEAVAEPTDCYAMGVMLFEALTGRRPFGGTVTGSLVSRAEDDAPASRIFAPQAPADLDRLCSALLEREPSARPRAAGVRVLAMGGEGQETGAALVKGRGDALVLHDRPFVGRAAELSVLREAFIRSEGGQASLVLVSGPSGIGKSALLERFLSWVQEERPGTMVLMGRCHQQESVPYKGVDAAVDSLARFLRRLAPEERALYLGADLLRLAQLFPVLLPFTLMAPPIAAPGEAGPEPSPTDHPELEFCQLRQRAFGALRELLRRIGAVRPLLLLLDDLQWGDDDSGALLAELIRGPGAPPLCFVGASRSAEAEMSPLLARLLGSEPSDVALPPRDRVELRPLPRADSERLAELLLADAVDSDRWAGLAGHIARVSEGNPFLLGELSWFLHEPGDEDALGPSVKRVVERRLSPLTPASRRLLEITALSGVPLGTELLLDAARIEAAGPEVLAGLLAARLVRVQPVSEGDGLECYHDRIREAVAAQIGPKERRQYHAALVRVLQATDGVDPELIARHLVEAGERGEALGWMVKAAQRAMEALAFDRSARLFGEAANLAPRAAKGRAPLRQRQGEALAAAGRSADAGRVFLQAAAEAHEGDGLELKLRAAELLLKGGHYDDALPVTREVFRQLGMRLPAGRVEAYGQAALELAWLRLRGLGFTARPEPERSRRLLRVCDACWAVAEPLQAVDPVLGYVLVLRNTRHSLRSGDPFRAGRALALQCVQTSMLEPCSRAPIQALAAATAVAREAGDVRLGPLLELASATAAFFRGDFPCALADGLEADRLLHRGDAGMQWESSTAALVILGALQWLGRWGELAHHLPAVLRAATDRGDLYGAATISGAFGGFPGMAADDVDRADRDIATFRVRHSRDLRCVPQTYEVISRCYLSLYRGAPATTVSELDRRWPELRRQGITDVGLILVELCFLRGSAIVGCLAQGARGTEAAALSRRARQAIASLRGSGLPVGLALSALLEACLDLAEGRLAPGMSGLARAVPPLAALGLALHADAAEHLRGRLLGGDEGRRLVVGAESRMRSQGIWEGGRMAALFAPG